MVSFRRQILWRHSFNGDGPASRDASSIPSTTRSPGQPGDQWTNHRSQHGPSTNVFLLGDTIEPDIVSLLLKQAGDIESNPGPDNCKDCGSAFSQRTRPVQCGECEGWFCKIAKKGQKTTCSGLTRWKLDKVLKEGKKLVCRICKGETARHTHPFNEGILPGRCGRRGCGTKQKIKATDDFLVCTRCSKHFHKRLSCCGMSRKQVDTLQRERWVCPNCDEDDQEKEDNIEVEEQGVQGTQYKQTKTSDTTLKMVQLNTDSIMSKIEELKDFNKKNEIDVFAIQETKLIKSDKTPKVPGYTVEREDRVQPKGK